MHGSSQLTTRPDERRVLGVAMGLNALMFVVGILAGYIADSLGLVADSLDMLADAGAYGLSLAAIGRSTAFKVRVARTSGIIPAIIAPANPAHVLP